MKDAKTKPDELNTDNGSEFTNRGFRIMLE